MICGVLGIKIGFRVRDSLAARWTRRLRWRVLVIGWGRWVGGWRIYSEREIGVSVHRIEFWNEMGLD